MRLRTVLIVVYLVVGLIVANSDGFFKNLNGIKPVISALLGVLLWPLVLLGVDLHIR